MIQTNQKGEITYSFDMRGIKNPEEIAKAGLIVMQNFTIARRFENGKVEIRLILNPQINPKNKDTVGQVVIRTTQDGYQEPITNIEIDISSSMKELRKTLNSKGLLGLSKIKSFKFVESGKFETLSQAMGLNGNWLSEAFTQILLEKSQLDELRNSYIKKIK